MVRVPWVLLCLSAACADGTSTLTLTIGASGTVSGVDHLRLTVTDVTHARTATPVDVLLKPRPATIPPEQTVAIRFASDFRAVVDAVVEARDANDQKITDGAARGLEIAPSKSVHAAVTLGAAAGPDLGADAGEDLASPGDAGDGGLPLPDGGTVFDPDHSKLMVDKTIAAADGVDTITVTAQMLDANGVPLRGTQVNIVANPPATIAAVPLTDLDGKTTTTLTSTVAGDRSVYATTGTLGPPNIVPRPPLTIHFTGGPVETLAFVAGTPSDVAVATPFSPPVQVALLDHFGNPAASTDAVSLAISTDPAGGAKLLGVQGGVPVKGVATLAPAGIDRAGAGFKLTASLPGVPAVAPVTSAPFAVLASPWTAVNTGLSGGPALDVAADPNGTTVYAATPSGVYRSLDTAANWSRASFGLTGSASTLTLDPMVPTTLYVTTESGVWRSLDGATTWMHLYTGSAFGVVAAPGSATLYVLASGLQKSTDFGATFTATTLTPDVQKVAIHPTQPMVLYALMIAGGVMRTSDGGATWAPMTTGLPNGTARDLCATSTGAWAVGSDGLVYREMSGPSWAATPANPAGPVDRMAASTTAVYAAASSGGTYRSVTNGSAWTTLTIPVNVLVRRIALNAADDAYYATDHGVYTVAHNATTLTAVSNGIPAEVLALTAPSATVLYAGTNLGVSRSANAGASWSATAALSLRGSSLAEPAGDTATVFVNQGNLVSRTSNSGTNWTSSTSQAVTGFGDLVAMAAPSPSPKPLVWAAVQGVNTGQVLKSVDGGDHFVDATGGALGSSAVLPGGALALDPVTPRVFVSTNTGIYRTTNPAGTAWTHVAGTPFGPATGGVMTLADSDHSLVMADNNTTTVYFSSDLGGTWAPQALTVLGANMGMTATAIHAPLPSLVYLALEAFSFGPQPNGPQVVRALLRDSGGTWAHADLGLPPVQVNVIAVDPTDPQTVYLGTEMGVLKSTSGGQ